MTNDTNFDLFADKVKAAAVAIGAFVIDAFLDAPENSGVPQATLGAVELINVIQHTKPKAVYLVETNFQLDTEIEDLRDELTVEDEEAGAGDSNCLETLDTLAKKWRKYDGKPCLAIAAVMLDGALLTALSRPPWREAFQSDLEAAREEIARAREEERFALSARDSAEVREKAAKLAVHPSFSAGRPSFEKRVFLAENLFPDLDAEILHAITRRAEKIDWLAKSGFKE